MAFKGYKERTILTPSQPNITSLGTLTNLNVNGALYGFQGIQGTILTPSQSNITSLGTLTNLNVNGNTSGSTLSALNLLSAKNIYCYGDGITLGTKLSQGF